MFSAEWLRAAAIDWLSRATSISRAWIVGDRAADEAPTRNTPAKSPTGFATVKPSSTSAAARMPKNTYMLRRTLQSASRPPARLPIVMPRPNTMSTTGTIDGGRPVTSVASGAT